MYARMTTPSENQGKSDRDPENRLAVDLGMPHSGKQKNPVCVPELVRGHKRAYPW